MIRLAEPRDADAWAAMRARLWPDADAAELAGEVRDFLDGRARPTMQTVFIALDAGATPIGFLELALRAYSDGCVSTPVPFVEGWYVEAAERRLGTGRRLIRAAEEWSRTHDFTEIASDAGIENTGSLRAHVRCGFEEVERIVKFRKSLI